MIMENRFDVIVVGAGHEGSEAALACAGMGARTACFVLKMESIGRMSCNPTVGGPAKGHLARELDALGGAIGHVADLTGIQFRMLNHSKGPAVWAPRSQNDRQMYSVVMREFLERQSNLHLIESDVVEIITDDGRVSGVVTAIGERYYAPKVILANGTFLKGVIHVGSVNVEGGRSGEPASNHLSDWLVKTGFEVKRFKTGTPPRVDLRTVNMNRVEEQPGDNDPEGFSYYRDIKLRNDVSCYLTHTTPETHRIIEENLRKSSLYGGFISGTGPRYCPSIEDKIVKFSTKEHHHVFIEPEGTNTFEAYVNGVSNSLPPYVQQKMLNSIPGLEKAIIMRYGYAIEYDFIVPTEINVTMETKRIKGLYFAGQINGTSGYEEAASQGFAAGVNAVLSLDNKEPLVFDRSESYMGVLLDDLVTKGTTEPYRLFTSRAEYRLYLRQDNADERLMEIGYKLGLVEDVRWRRFRSVMDKKEREMEILKTQKSFKAEELSEPVKLYQLLKRPDIEFSDLPRFGYKLPADLDRDVIRKLSLECKYEGYLKRQLADIDRYAKMEHISIPDDLDFMKIQSISYEAREKMIKVQPRNIGQVMRISGVNFTDISALLIYLKKKKHLKDADENTSSE
jgi:tRNA uridine 5-carboxymethylaminomethyl modification enzyme